MLKLKAAIIIAAIFGVGVFVFQNQHASAPSGSAKNSSSTAAKTTTKSEPNQCASNTLGQVVIVSVSKQHMWACDGTKVSYDNPVVTGMQQYPSELTPVGTYKIYGKLTDQTLTGSDFTGHWSDYVYYWMPFLTNSYGTYGFHDLTAAANGAAGRQDSDFGNIDINAPYTAAKHGSHGCVELPLTAAKWLYGWAAVGTTVSIIS